MTFAQLDALASAGDVTADELARYMVHQQFREYADKIPERCSCGGDPEALKFCYAPVHFRPWWWR